MTFGVVYRNAHRINSPHVRPKLRRSSIEKSEPEASGGKCQTPFVVLDFGLEINFRKVVRVPSPFDRHQLVVTGDHWPSANPKRELAIVPFVLVSRKRSSA
jgi:hypothetical protein